MICIYIGNMLFCKHFPTLNLHFNKRQFPFVLVYSFLFLSNILNANLIDNHKVGKICKLPNMQYHVLSIYVFKFIVFIFNGKKDMSDPHELTYVMSERKSHVRAENLPLSQPPVNATKILFWCKVKNVPQQTSKLNG